MKKVINIKPSTDPLWQRLISQHKSDVFHTPGWIKVLEDTYDFDIRALVVVDEAGKPKAGLTYCKIEDMMDARVASLPFSDFCDPLAQSREDWDLLIGALLEEKCRLSMRILHNELPLDDGRVPMVGRAKWHSVDLRREVEEMWQGLDGSARRAIKKAQRQDVEVRIAQDKNDLRAFFELHLGVRKYKYQLVAQPYPFFEHIWDNFIAQGCGALMVAAHQEEVVAGVLFLEWQDKLYYKFNASNPESIRVRPNDLIVWEAMKYGQARGYEYLDFGISDWDQEGLLRYKRKYATDEKTVSFLRYTPDSSPSPKEKSMRMLLPQLTDLFVDEGVPDHVTERAGEVLYRFFT